MLQTQSGTVECNGASLAYEAGGAGPPLVMLHGHLLDQHQPNLEHPELFNRTVLSFLSTL